MKADFLYLGSVYSCARDFTRRMRLMVFLTVFTAMTAYGQIDSLTLSGGFLKSQEAAAKEWLDDLYSHGVQIKGDSVYFNDETRRISTDSSYRNIIYPESYTWEMVQALMRRKALKPAIWHLINLYHADTTHRDLVLQMILPLDQVLEIDRVVVATFYTYIPFDPQVYTIVNGKTLNVKRPDIAEHKLLAAKAIVGSIQAQRALEKSKGE